MATGYTRQSSGVIINNGTINASDFNNEFNLLQTAFDATSGHTHDGTTGGGALIPLGTAVSGTLPASKGGTGINNGSSNITIGGNVTFSGAYTFTGTLTANTSVTFPTSGTLVNTAVATLSSLTSIGTIGTGVWQGTTIGVSYGGTGVTSATGTGSVVLSASPTLTGTPAIAAATATTQSTSDNSTNVATTAYVQANIAAVTAGMTFKNSVYAATTANLNATYVNGVSGVGATLTNAGADAAFSVDGQSPTATSRILVKNQSTAYQNGIYTVTTVGDGTHAWVLTRSTDYNTAAEIHPGDLVPVDNGTVNGSSAWLQTASVTTIGTDSISFSEYVYPAAAFLQPSNNLSDVASTSTSRTNLGLAIGTNVEAWSATLDAVAGGTYTGASSITTLGTVATGVWHGTVISGTYGGTGVNNGSSTITIGGNVTFSGAYTFTGTVTANTSVTFPTSGTLAALSGTNTWTGNQTVSSASFGLSGNISASAWTTNGIRYKNVAATLTDTSSSGTVAAAYTDLWGGNTIAASSATTFTKYYGSYFAAPVAGTNVTLTNKYALGADSIDAAAITVNGTAVQTGAPNYSLASGFVNRLRNNSLTSWFHGTSGSITTAGGWTAEGVYCVPTGATVTFAQNVDNLQNGYYALKIVGASSNTDVKLRFVVSGFDAMPLVGQTQTIQFVFQNNSGASITPTISVYAPTALDNYGSTNTIVSAQNMQTVANSGGQVVAYTWTDTSGYETYGLSIDIDFGAMASNSDNIRIFGMDLRATPGVSTGINNSAPTPEIRDAQSDIAWNQRYFWSSYPNGTAGGTSMTATSYGLVGGWATNSGYGMNFTFPVPLRAAPTVAVWDRAGNLNKFSSYSSGWNDNQGTVNVVVAGPTNAVLNGSNNSAIFWAMTADATITGA